MPKWSKWLLIQSCVGYYFTFMYINYKILSYSKFKWSLLLWEHGKILDGYKKLPSKPQYVKKSTFNHLVGLKETHMVKFMHGLKAHEILLWDQPMMGSNLHLLTMTKFSYNMKKKRVIRNGIMVFHKNPQPMAQNLHPYTKEMWKKIKLQYKYNKALFALLERTLTDDFFKGKICMNLPKDPSSNEFNKVFE